MRKINYKSDFDAVLRLRDCEDPDKFVPWPDCDFEVVFWTSGKARCHTASRNGGTYTNCFATEDGGIHFVFDNHRMGIGTLKWEPHFALPNGIYPDGIQDIYRRADLGITLVDGEGDCPTTADVEVLVPYIKFKYEDLTDAEKAELGKPATDAAASVAELERSVETAEAGRVANEKSRVAAETTRQTDEATRQSQEAQRQEAEAEREENEDRRASAESKRAEEFAAWQDEIDSKADRSELSNVIAEEPLTPGNFPDINTYTREELKKDLFVDMWNARCVVCSSNYAPFIRRNTFGQYNEETGFFELNGLTDVTYEQAVEIMRVPDVALSNPTNGILAYSRARTFFPIIVNNSLSGICNCMANAEVIRIVDYYIVNNGADPETSPISIAYTGDAFNQCWKLREIKGILKLGINDNNNKHFGGSALIRSDKLETIWLQNLCLDASLKACASLRAECVAYMVEHAANTKAITITLHPTAYARVTDELFALAAAKNITFATT